MTIFKVQHIRIDNLQECYACCRSFPAGSRMKVQSSDEIKEIHLCTTCDQLIRTARQLFVEDSELICRKGCVADILIAYQVETPEELHFILTTVDFNPQNKPVSQAGRWYTTPLD